jgi:ribosome-associated translation inhibitor RaiA
VQKFAEKHLKPLANDSAITTTIAAIKEEITKQIKERCEKQIAEVENNWYGSVSKVKLNPAIKSEIDGQVRNLVDSMIRTAVEDAIKMWSNDSELKTRIDKRFEYYTTDLINAEIKGRIEKLKAKL